MYVQDYRCVHRCCYCACELGLYPELHSGVVSGVKSIVLQCLSELQQGLVQEASSVTVHTRTSFKSSQFLT